MRNFCLKQIEKTPYCLLIHVVFDSWPHDEPVPFYPENNSVSTIRIRLQKVIKCLGPMTFWVRSIFVTWFVVTLQNATKCMFPKSTCLKTNSDTYLKFLFPLVAENSAGEVDQFCSFFAFPAIHAFTKLVITFDGLNWFFWIIACFKGHNMSVHPALFKIWNSTLLKFFGWSEVA